MPEKPDDLRKYVVDAILQLTTREGMSPEKIPLELIEAIGVSTPQEACAAIQAALSQLPKDAYTEALRFGLGGPEFPHVATRRYEILAEKYKVIAPTIKYRAGKGAQRVADLLLTLTSDDLTLTPKPSAAEAAIIGLLQEMQQSMDEQTALLREIRDALQK